MNAFLPFQPAGRSTAGAESFRPRIVSAAAGPVPAFTPIATAPKPAQPEQGPGEQPKHEPKLTVIRDGDRITRIRIECGCGEILDLPCVY